MVSHSWGDTVFRCFLSWISVKDPDWVERYVAVYTNIAGPTLGVPKAVSSFLSGDDFHVIRATQAAPDTQELHNGVHNNR